MPFESAILTGAQAVHKALATEQEYFRYCTFSNASLEGGHFDGVFIAADGSDCVYGESCTEKTGKLVGKAHELMKERAIDPARLRMAAICSVCSESFVKQMEIELGKKIQTGQFGADMKVSLVNDGPVTIIIDTKNKE